MTLAEGKQIVRFLLDAEVYFQYENKLSAYFDLGQKRIACTTDFLCERHSLSVEGKTEIDLRVVCPRFYRLQRVQGGAWEKIDRNHIRLTGGSYTLCYEAYPHTIDAETPETYQFEISEFAQTALPYFVASQITAGEHDLRYHQLYADEFAAILENAAEARSRGEIKLVHLERSRL